MKAVILAGGEGSRLRPLTLNRPKVMIPVANRPIIQYVIDALVANGIRDITVVVGYRKEHVIRHLNQMDIPINVVVQEKQLGAANALKAAETEVEGDFILLPGDNYIDISSIAKIAGVKNAMLVKEHPYPSNFGVVITRDGYVVDIIEKPAQSPSFMISTGIFTLNTAIFNYLDYMEIPEAIGEMIAQEGLKVRAIQAEQWHDAIYPWDLLRINSQSLSDISPKKGGRLSKGVSISGPVHIGDEVTIGPNTIIQGPAVIGDNCEIGPNTVIMPNTSIGPGVRIEPFTYIGNTILMEDVRIGSHSRCIDSVVGAGTRFADHTTTNTGLCVMEDDGKLIKGKFGVVVGDRVSSAPFTVFNHCLVGNSVSIEEGKMIRKNIPDHVVVR